MDSMITMQDIARTAAVSCYPKHGMPVAFVAPLAVPFSATGLSFADAASNGQVAADQRTRIAPKGAPPRGELR